MADLAITLANSSAGTQASTSNSRDDNIATYDQFTVGTAATETIQWGFSSTPKTMTKYRVRFYAEGIGAEVYIYAIPAGITNPASYTLIRSIKTSGGDQVLVAGDNDTTQLTLGAPISSDGLYLKITNIGDAGGIARAQDVYAWENGGSSATGSDSLMMGI